MAAKLTTAALVLATLCAPVRGGLKYPDCANGPLKSNQVCNTSASPETRASALVAAMSNSEKLANLVKYDTNPLPSPLREKKRHLHILQKATPQASPASACPPTNGGTRLSTGSPTTGG